MEWTSAHQNTPPQLERQIAADKLVDWHSLLELLDPVPAQRRCLDGRPADRKLYALRDITATVAALESPPLNVAPATALVSTPVPPRSRVS